MESLFDEEEALLTLHMEVIWENADPVSHTLTLSMNIPYYHQVIQENAELLTEEGRLLQQVGLPNYSHANDVNDSVHAFDVYRFLTRCRITLTSMAMARVMRATSSRNMTWTDTPRYIPTQHYSTYIIYPNMTWIGTYALTALGRNPATEARTHHYAPRQAGTVSSAVGGGRVGRHRLHLLGTPPT